ncbi:MAG: 6-phosphogluconolactonase, partial [Candidatus Heimdallarchaeota archaeon]|nr:6-phosphogluconolactonase [Candidatus Heimdallarchaeota archaeon]
LQSTHSVNLGLSGGMTPRSLYEKLGLLIENHDITHRVNFFQVDERFVDQESQRSNQKMIIKTLINQISDPKKYSFSSIPLVNQVADISESARLYHSRLDQLFGRVDSKSTILLLGMGTDGHTASLFPQNNEYLNSFDDLDNKVLHTFVEHFNENRVSLTPNFILKANEIIILLLGADKGRTFARTQTSENYCDYPILSITKRHQNITVFMDKQCHLEILRSQND